MARFASLPLIALTLALMATTTPADPIHTTYLWHMHQPIYWPNPSVWDSRTYEFAHETITNNTAQNDVFTIFDSDDRVHDYQDYPRTAINSILWTADGGTQVSFAGSLIQNINSLAAAGWNGGRYASNWTQPYRDAHAWTTSGGRTRLDPVIVAFHHSINPLVDEDVFRKMIQAQKAILPSTWGDANLSKGFFPAEMCFSERLIPVLVEEGIEWSIVADIHLARATAGYPYQANLDNCDPPNPADQLNPAQAHWDSQSISRGVTVRVPVPFALQPHHAQHVNPNTGAVDKLVVIPAANAMSWDEGYGLYGTGDLNRVAPYNDPQKPMLVVFAHDGDNAWQGGFSYYNENVSQFNSAAVGAGYEPSTIAEYLADHPVSPTDIVKVEDGGWVNADGDFGSPQFINWNWPLFDASGHFDIPNGWAEDERNWAVLTAAVNHVVTAEDIAGPSDPANIADPRTPGSSDLEKAWHFLLAGHESGYMYYGTSLDFEVKPSLAANAAVSHAASVIASNPDNTPPTVWLPQRLPWNPGGYGGGALWGYPGGQGAVMSQDFHVWTFAHDVSGISAVTLYVREDLDGVNPLATVDNETYAGGSEVESWTVLPMNQRSFPAGNVHNNPEIDFFVMPSVIADQYWLEVTGYEDVLLDYYVEAVDSQGNVKRSPIQHVYVGSGGTTGGGGDAVTWSPENPQAGDALTIAYDPVPGALADDTNPVYIHVGHSGWTQVIAPDPAMTYDAQNAGWTFAYSIPAGATSVEFVFNDGGANWDNNEGADWSLPVSGAQPPPYTIDGSLDAGVPVLASCDGFDLHGDYDGEWLYLAAPVNAAPALDRFLLVADASGSSSRSAPWAKAGTVFDFDLLVGNEESNNWAGWFDGTETLTTTGVDLATGAYLEGRVHVTTALGFAPTAVRVAFAGYGSGDGAGLALQIPCGDADGNLDATESVMLTPSTSSVDPSLPTSHRIEILSGNPIRGRLQAVVRPAAGPVTVDILDIRGRRVQQLFRGESTGDISLVWNAQGTAGGVYFLRVQDRAGTSASRIVHLNR